MSQKIKLMFDATILGYACNKNADRGGIFFCTYEIIKRIAKKSEIDLSFYSDPKTSFLLKRALKTQLKEFNYIKVFPKLSHIDYLFSELKDIKHTKNLEKKVIAKYFFHFLLFISKLFLKIPNKLCHIFIDQPFDCDCFFSPCYACPTALDNYPHIKKYTLIHDTIPLLFKDIFPQKEQKNSWLENLIQYMKIHPKDFYFANSRNTKKDFLKILPNLNQTQIKVIPLACSEKFYLCSKEKIQNSLKKYQLPIDKKYVFSLCSLAPHKNLIRSVKTFIQFIKKNHIDDLVFILGGGHYDDFINKLDKEIDNLGDYKDKIIKAGYIDDEDLAPLYSGAEWFVYTSQYEGFGLPPLEAMACGCPVITSNNSSLPEVVGEAGIMIDWDSDEQHIKAYEDYYFHPELCEKMKQKGLKRAEQFSWQKTTNLILKEILK